MSPGSLTPLHRRVLFAFAANVLWIAVAVFSSGSLSSCSDFNRALKSDSVEFKMAVADTLYHKAKYDRAIPLLEELIILRRADADCERWAYLRAKSYFLMKDYTMAAYYFENFVKTFPSSRYTEECAFLNAFCYFKNSPNYELDQADTRTALNELQLFMVRYPATALKDSCNSLIDQLRLKLEVKAYHAAEQYYHMRNYQGAGVAFREFLRQYPNSRFREDAMMRVLRADHALAMNSVENRKVERLQEAIRSYRNFADAYPQGVELEDAKRLHKELTAELEEAQKKP